MHGNMRKGIFDAHLVADQERAFGRGYSDNQWISDLAWGQSYVADGYIQLYKGTKDRKWLDKLVEQSDRVLQKAVDYSGAGSLGFREPRYTRKTIKNGTFDVRGAVTGATELVHNAGFESEAGSSAAPYGWSLMGNPGNIYPAADVNDSSEHTGIVLVSEKTSTNNYMHQSLPCLPGKTYTVEVVGGVDSDRSVGLVQVLNVADGNHALGSARITSVGCERYFFNFTAPPSGTLELRLGFYDYSADTRLAGNKVYYRHVSVKEYVVPPAMVESVPDGQHERSAAVKMELPAGFVSNAPLKNAYFTNSPLADEAVGGWAVALVQDGTNPGLSQELLNFLPNHRYRVQGSCHVSPSAAGVIRATDMTTNTVLGSLPLSHTKSDAPRMDFVTPAAGHRVHIEFAVTSPDMGDTLYVRSIEAQPFHTFMINDARIANPMLQFANIVYDDPKLKADPHYLAKANDYRDFAAGNLFRKNDPFWKQITGVDGQDSGTGVYTFGPGPSYNNGFSGRSIPNNHYLGYATMLYLLFDATEGMPEYASDRILYKSRANDMLRQFKNTLMNQTSDLGTPAYQWYYWNVNGSWDIGHHYQQVFDDLHYSSISAIGPNTAYHRGQVFTRDDMEKFTNTFTDVMWNRSYDKVILSDDNSRKPAASHKTGSTSYWIDMAEYDHTVWEIVNALQEERGPLLYASAGLARWAWNKTLNGDMELSALNDETLPQFWERMDPSPSAPATAALDSTSPYGGKKSIAIQANTGPFQGIKQTIKDYEPNTEYTLTLQGRTSGGAIGRADAYNAATDTILESVSFSDASWKPYSLTFLTPLNGTDPIQIRVYPESVQVGGTVYGDDILALPFLYNSEIPNGSFEVQDKSDLTLPRYWKRAAGTTAEDVSVTGAEYDRSIRMNAAAANPKQSALYYDWKGYSAGGNYRLTAKVKTNGMSGKLVITDLAANGTPVETPFASADWQTLHVSFFAPGTPGDPDTDYDHVLRVSIESGPATGDTAELWVDDIGIMRVYES
ncbi:hypothetical protein FE783_13915 [Paenibacillus mesophilus]|uniref:hypothetical protein n=1 Tax=Paenibacillus mesophilus TaxID=2582849 RepID=UPI00110D38F7|nr:hypothetical protein [Paenibacillus mesophilus]TMV49591.1 hypothetical protein FE783_13915 [Paenibacillus mesophilus]